jgi:murein DD-endopeptidase MepM/ murein hydrolase activator NlpD
MASVGPSGWAVPVRGPVTSGYGPRGESFHAGTDISVPKGTKVHAATSGTVSTVACNARRAEDKSPYSCNVDGSLAIEGCGWYVDIQHADGILTRYCHLRDRPYVKVGQKVAAGQLIGLSGNSGNSSGPHLHFEVHVRGRTVDPEPFMAQRGAALGQVN